MQQDFIIYVSSGSNLTTDDPQTCASYPSEDCSSLDNLTMTISCTCRTPYLMGRYVTIRQDDYTSPYVAVLTICEVVVYGSRVTLLSDGEEGVTH
jgi:hypothetical protein